MPSGYPVADSLRNSHLDFSDRVRALPRRVQSGRRGAGPEAGIDRDVSGTTQVRDGGFFADWMSDLLTGGPD